MNEIDTIEDKICLLEKVIDFKEIVEDYLKEYKEGVDLDPVEFRIDKAYRIIKRFSDIYNFNIITSSNGCSNLLLSTDANTTAKKYLHYFLVYKNETGGEGANRDGSAELFEKISANAAKNYLGVGAQSILIGEGRERLSEEVLKTSALKLNENSGTFHDLPARAQDDGVDFIVFRPFDSRNIGNVIILGQACVGKHFVEKKPIKARWKDDYFKYAVRPPLTLLSTVSYLEADKLRYVHAEFDYAIVFDRGRTMRYYDTSDTELNAEIESWVNANIRREE